MINCVYILLRNDGSFYTGSTKSLTDRLARHNNGRVKSTKNFRPLKLLFYQQYADIKTARKVEAWLKKQKKRSLLEKIIDEGIIKKFD